MTDPNDQKPSLGDIRRFVEASKLSLEQDVEYIGVRAALYRAAYDSLTGHGFTEAQAMQFILTRGPMLY